MNNLRLNCSISSSLPPTIIGILEVAVVSPVENVALCRTGIKFSEAVIQLLAQGVIHNMHELFNF